MKEIYFDNSATTALSEAAKNAMKEAMEVYGNPSSLHAKGNAAKEVLEESRRKVGKTLGLRHATADELVFTSCGTESDQLAIFGAALAKERRKGGTVITTDSEHPAVENAMERLEGQGFTVIRISTRGGVLNLDEFEKALAKKPFLISMMTVNNEIGARYEIERAFAMAKEQDPEVITHTDAVQAYLKVGGFHRQPIVDLLSVSAHKIHGPKGVGALLISPEAKKRKDLIPVQPGGGQENGMRSGTENLVGIAGFAAAAEEGFLHADANIEQMKRLREKAEGLLRDLPVKINQPSGAYAPHILSATLPGVRSETMLHALSARGIYLSSGSACSSHSAKPSRSLLAFGLTPAEAETTVRISFSAENTEEEVCIFATALGEELNRLVRVKSFR